MPCRRISFLMSAGVDIHPKQLRIEAIDRTFSRTIRPGKHVHAGNRGVHRFTRTRRCPGTTGVGATRGLITLEVPSGKDSMSCPFTASNTVLPAARFLQYACLTAPSASSGMRVSRKLMAFSSSSFKGLSLVGGSFYRSILSLKKRIMQKRDAHSFRSVIKFRHGIPNRRYCTELTPDDGPPIERKDRMEDVTIRQAPVEKLQPFNLSPAGGKAPLRLRHLEVERGWGKGTRLRVSEHPQGLALRLCRSHATWASSPFDALQTPKASTTGEAFHFFLNVRVALDCQTVSWCRGRWLYSKPPREVTFPIRPQDFSVGLFTAAGLCAYQVSCADLPHKRSGSAGRSVCRQTRRHGALHIVTVFGPGGLGNRFSSLFSRKPLHLGSGVEQLPPLGFDLALQYRYSLT